jgi:acyl-CoA thioester hydrolase
MFYEVIKPRVGETDALGHINNTVFPQWFEAARNPIFKLFNPESALNLNQWNLILANMSINFHVPLKFGKDVEIKTFIKRIGNTSLDVYQEAWQDNILHVSGTAIMVHYDYTAKKPQPIADIFKQKLHMHFLRTM